MSIEKTACFFGHRKIEASDGLKTILYEEIEKLITVDGIVTFLFGSKSQFDNLCYKIVTELKSKYPDIRRISRKQYEEYASKRGMDDEKARRFLGHLL